MASPPAAKQWLSFLNDNALLDVEEAPATNPFFWCSGGGAAGAGSAGVVSAGKRRREDEKSEELCGVAAGVSAHGLKSKACREKERRGRLNERFEELAVAVDPGRPPKTDRAAVLADAVRVVEALREDVRQLREANVRLMDANRDLKAEKNELRDEKAALKAEKVRLDHQLKQWSAMAPPGAAAAAAAAAAPPGVPTHKTQPMIMPMPMAWHWLPPQILDTSQDHVLRPPVA
eukprot:jgi/Chlat1/2267/Chrsp17S02574